MVFNIRLLRFVQRIFWKILRFFLEKTNKIFYAIGRAFLKLILNLHFYFVFNFSKYIFSPFILFHFFILF